MIRRQLPARAKLALREAARKFAHAEEVQARSPGNVYSEQDLADARDALDEMALSLAVSLGYKPPKEKP